MEKISEDILTLSSYSLLIKSTANQNKGKSNSEDQDIVNLRKAIHDMNTKFNERAEEILTGFGGLIKLRKWNSNSRRMLSSNEEQNSFELSECSTNNYQIVTTEFSSKFYSKSESNHIIFSAISGNNDGTQELLNSCKSYFVKLPISEGINVELYRYYYSKGIDIYNKEDNAFKPCFISDNFDYDLTQKYRKRLYQGSTITSSVSGCEYVGYDSSSSLIGFKCDLKEKEITDISDYSYVLKEEPLENVNHVDNLPTKCAEDVKNVHKNIGFWLYTVLFVVCILIGSIVGFIGCKGISAEEGCENDEITYPNQVSQNDKESVHGDQKVSTNQINVSIPSFGQTFTKNLKELHPLLSMCHQSVVRNPTFLCFVFFYNVMSLFGFNSLYFNETMLEDRIHDKHRDNFGYPMKTEFEKIMSSIVTCIGLTVIVKLITLTTISKKNELGKSQKSEEIVRSFNKAMLPRYIVAGIFMLILSVFFYYYTVVFCGMYVNAQYGWFYSGIWSLFMNWILFAPFYILIISVVQRLQKNDATYYMKQLFVF